MADNTTQAPTTSTTTTTSSTTGLTKQTATVANPSPAAPPTTTGPMELVLAIADGLIEIAQAEGSQGKPSAKPWGDLKRKLEATLDDMGLRIAPAPASSLRAPTPAVQRQTANRMQMKTPYGPRRAVAPIRMRRNPSI